MSDLAPIGRYERVLGASLERLFENALDWEHLPHLHDEAFSGIDLIAEDETGWCGDATLPDGRRIAIDLRLDRAIGRWVTENRDGDRLLSRIVTDARAEGPVSCSVSVEFFIDGLPPAHHAAALDWYRRLYASLYDGDEAMMKARTKALRDGAAAHAPRRPVKLADGRTVSIPLACPHQGMPLDAEPDAAGIVTCPWHGYRFDAVTGRNVDGKACGWA